MNFPRLLPKAYNALSKTKGRLEMKTNRILFLCTGNSARSQIAEGLLRTKGGSSFEVYSAGIEPKSVNPYALQVMSEIGIDISNQRSKDVSAVIKNSFDWVITVCDHAKERCPVFPSARLASLGYSRSGNIERFQANSR